MAERLARPRDVAGDALVVVAVGARADHDPAGGRGGLADGETTGSGTTGAIGRAVAGLDLRWVAVDLAGRRSRATPRPEATPTGNPGVDVPLDLAPLDEGGGGDIGVGLVLPCWTLLGMLDRAIDLTTGYVCDRHQFGQALSSFPGVQFQLTDAEVQRAGLDELATYALWSVASGKPDALADALAVRLAAIEAAEVVFRVTHQLQGAIGFCDEMALSWVSRASQPLRRLPFGPFGHPGQPHPPHRPSRLDRALLVSGPLTVVADGPVRTLVRDRPDHLRRVRGPSVPRGATSVLP